MGYSAVSPLCLFAEFVRVKAILCYCKESMQVKGNYLKKYKDTVCDTVCV